MRWRIDQRRVRVELELLLDAPRKRDPGLQRAPRRIEIDPAIVGDRLVERDQRGGVDVVRRARCGQIGARSRHRRDLAQRRIAGVGHRHEPVHRHPRPALDRQMPHRAVDHQPRDVGEPRLGPRGTGSPRRVHRQRVGIEVLTRPVDRLQPQIAARELDARAVIERRDVANIVDHENPPRHGEGDRQPLAGGGGGAPRTVRWRRAPSTMRCMVPLPVPGRICSITLTPPLTPTSAH